MTEAASSACVDLLVVGGGMVGASLVAALRHHCPERSLALVEAAPQTEQSPSFDGRASALAYGSRLLFERWGLWPALEPHCTAIERIHVSARGHFGATRLYAEQEQVPALGYVLENQALGQVLQSSLSADQALQRYEGTAVNRVRFVADGAEVTLNNGARLKTRLLLLADGGRSGLMAQLGIRQEVHDYQQSALVTWVEPQEPHQGCAFERFTDEGPMALLPLADNRMALVWSMDHEQANLRQQLSETEFLQQLQAHFGERLGPFIARGPVHSYPLSLRQACEQVRSRLVVLGNAAHNLHPVAGQGFNLCLRDIEALVLQLKRGEEAGEPLGQLSRLQHYLEQQRWDQQRTSLGSDLLVRGFGASVPLLSGLRSLGLVGLDRCAPLKHWFARTAMGLDNG